MRQRNKVVPVSCEVCDSSRVSRWRRCKRVDLLRAQPDAKLITTSSGTQRRSSAGGAPLAPRRARVAGAVAVAGCCGGAVVDVGPLRRPTIAAAPP